MLGISCQPPEPPVSSLSHWNTSSIRPRLASRNIHRSSLMNGFSCSISALLHQEKWLKCFPGSCCIHECSFHRKRTSEPMAIEPMFMRRNYGQEVYSFPHSAPVFLEGNILCCFTLSSLYQAWTVFHPLLCKYRITSNRENWEKLHPDVSV